MKNLLVKDTFPILQERDNRIRWIFSEAVFAEDPLVDELPGTQVAHNPL